MVQPAYSFLDVAVLDGVRERLAAGDALAVLSSDLLEIVWANGPGAALLGYADISAALGEASNLGAVARRQVMATPGYPQIGRGRAVMVRLASGMASHPVQVLASALRLPDGEEAILLAVPFSHGASRDPRESAARAIAGFAGDGQYAAILDGQGRIEAASAGFEKLGIAAVTLQAATADAATQPGRLAKRMLSGDAPHPAGLARLTDQPTRYLLVVIDERIEPESADAGAGTLAAATVPETAGPSAEASHASAEVLIAAPAALAHMATPAGSDSAREAAEAASGVAPEQAGDPVRDIADPGAVKAEYVAELPAETDASEHAPEEPEFSASADDSVLVPGPVVGDSVQTSEASASAETIPDQTSPESREDGEADAIADLTPVVKAEPVVEAASPNADGPVAGEQSSAEAEPSAEVQTQAPAAAETQSAAQPEAQPPAGRGSVRPAIDRSAVPLRFVWRTDSNGRFSQISPEFGEALGAAAADVVGKPFREVASRFGLDPEGEIAGLLERRDTWSGRSVLWPLAGTEFRVPVDLAALPVYDRNRNFEGFRGFGVARIGEAAADPRAIGLMLARAFGAEAREAAEASAAAPETRPSETQAQAKETASPAEPAATPSIDSADPFRGEVPALEIAPRPERRQSDKVIRLAEHRQNGIDKSLSPGERSAFREIGERLKGETAVPGQDSVGALSPSSSPREITATKKPAEVSATGAVARETAGGQGKAAGPVEAEPIDAQKPALTEAASPGDTSADDNASGIERPPAETLEPEAKAAEPAPVDAGLDALEIAETGPSIDAPADLPDLAAPVPEMSGGNETAEPAREVDDAAVVTEPVPDIAGAPAARAPAVTETAEPAAPRRPRKLSLLDYGTRDEPVADAGVGVASVAEQARAADLATVAKQTPVVGASAGGPEIAERGDNAAAATSAESRPTTQIGQTAVEGRDAGDMRLAALNFAAEPEGAAGAETRDSRSEASTAGAGDEVTTEGADGDVLASDRADVASVPVPDEAVSTAATDEGQPVADAIDQVADAAEHAEPEAASADMERSPQAPETNVAADRDSGGSRPVAELESRPEPGNVPTAVVAAVVQEPGAQEPSRQEAVAQDPSRREPTRQDQAAQESATRRPAVLLENTAAEVAPKTSSVEDEMTGLAASLPEEDLEPRADEEPEPAHPTDTSILERLPVPLLIHVADRLYYANPEFLALSGHNDLADLEQAGGLGSLFVEPYQDEDVPGGGDHALKLRDKAGNEHPIEAVLRSVPWNGGNALMLVVRRTNQQFSAAADALSAERENQLKARVVEMRTIIDTATDGVVLIGSDGTIRSISRPAEAMFGFDSEDVVGKPFASLFAPESQRSANDYLNGLLDHGVASVLNDGREVIGREAQGRFIPMFMTMGRLPGDTGFCAVLRDITQWKRAEEELTQARAQAEQASSLKTDFLARVSHEIRTPLNAIIGFSELMVDEKFGPVGNDRYRDYLRDINRSGSLVLDLVNDLLDISKIEAGQQEMSYEAVSLNDTLAETVALMQPQANRERVIIRSSFASRLPDVVADLRSIRQIALNILSNAVRYTPAGGQVIVSTAYEPSGDVVFRVRDTGVGMTPAEIEQALKPFKQINALKRSRGDGTGLGLPLTKAMVEANRARFTISSTPGEGTLVEIAFPTTRVLAG